MWAGLVRAELTQLGDGERVVVAHSLAVPLWLHTGGPLTEQERVDRVLLVSAPSPGLLAQHSEEAAFSRVQHEPAALRAAAGSTRLVHSDTDPYWLEGAPVAYAGLRLDADVVIPSGGHLDPEAGYGAWPSMHAWCHDPAVRLTAR